LLTFTTAEVRSAKRRKDYLAHQGHSHNLRSAVEATMRSVKHPFPVGKMPVRGQFRVTRMVIASAATANVRRIQRYLVAKTKATQVAKVTKSEPNRPPEVAAVSFFVSARALLARWLGSRLAFGPSLGY